jgi:hypothetical protein
MINSIAISLVPRPSNGGKGKEGLVFTAWLLYVAMKASKQQALVQWSGDHPYSYGLFHSSAHGRDYCTELFYGEVVNDACANGVYQTLLFSASKGLGTRLYCYWPRLNFHVKTLPFVNNIL